MKIRFFAAAAAALVISAAGGAFAAPPVSMSTPCTLVKGTASTASSTGTATPCVFGGNITSSNLTTVDNVYNGQSSPPSVSLDLESFLTSPDLVVDSSNGMGATSGTLTADPGFDIDYYAVKAANGFALYWIDPTTSLSWATDALCAGQRCNAPGLSHIVYFESPAPINIPSVPEPATWTMMLLGAFGMGALLRRRQSPAMA